MNFTLLHLGHAHQIDLLSDQNLNHLVRQIEKKIKRTIKEGEIRVGRIDGPILDELFFSKIKKQGTKSTKICLVSPKELQDLIQINSSNSQIPILQEFKEETQSKKEENLITKEREEKRQSIFLISHEHDELSYDIQCLNGISKSLQIEERDSLIQNIWRDSSATSSLKQVQEEKIIQQASSKEQLKDLSLNIPFQVEDKNISDTRVQNKKQAFYHEGDKQIIENIQCDRCFMFPIKGTIFRCLVCSSFDLCSFCQQDFHQFHPFLEISTGEHWPTSIKVLFQQENVKHMSSQLEKEELKIKLQKEQKYSNKRWKGQEVDPKTLKKKEIKGPNFMARLLGIKK